MAKSKAERVEEAEKAHKEGRPLPSGVTFNAYRVPQFLAIEDDPEVTDAERKERSDAAEAAQRSLVDHGVRIAEGASVTTPRTG